MLPFGYGVVRALRAVAVATHSEHPLVASALVESAGALEPLLLSRPVPTALAIAYAPQFAAAILRHSREGFRPARARLVAETVALLLVCALIN